MNLSNYVTSWLRTASPALAGAFITWAVAHGFGLSDTIQAPLSGAIFAASSAGYYALVRLLEHLRDPWGKWAGWLLGKPAKPTYPN